ncbi:MULTISPECIES: glycosyltransferase family 2 protein [unclassified Psychrobacter]|uniref:glycosyltransferase family 2 protein n=1 Tax=unclassified Psychrobacter TaxID=196806 RepID=UPI0004051846|nr:MULTISPECIES: glycosyltransferase family 2 protein [unclassified Psychrobacter]
MYYLSIIIPFHNSEDKSKRLLSTLSSIEDNGIELILVDDGSTDSTLTALEEFKESCKVNVIVIAQENKGPGGARNAGLKVAKGQYVWFVDSDDDIKPEALEEIKSLSLESYDLIAFNHSNNNETHNSMRLKEGVYSDQEYMPETLLLNFGWIWTNIFKRDLLINNGLFFPENCIYEDGPMTFFIYPFFIKTCYKSDTVAYTHNTEFDSITRGNEYSPRNFDRLFTPVVCFKAARKLTNNKEQLQLLETKFINYTLFGNVSIFNSLKPSKKWLITHKIMRYFREVSTELNLTQNHISLLESKSLKFKTYFLFHWYLSYLQLNDQTAYFLENRDLSWGKPIKLLGLLEPHQ